MQTNLRNLVIRPAKPGDTSRVVALIRAMAEYEKLEDQMMVDEETLTESLFSEQAVPRALVASVGEEIVGYAIYFYNFSTFVGKKGIYLEDIYVETEYRGRGIGDRLFRTVAETARKEGCARMEWVALDWNKHAIDFYQSRGASMLDEWRLFRFNRADLQALADA